MLSLNLTTVSGRSVDGDKFIIRIVKFGCLSYINALKLMLGTSRFV